MASFHEAVAGFGSIRASECAMHGVMDGYGSMWVWTTVGILLAVVLVIVIQRLLRNGGGRP